jgi:glycosyltransferase involved in cell wall biosynthesis
MTAFVMPHYIATDELRELAIQALTSMRTTSDAFLISVDDGSPLDTAFLDEYSDKVLHLKQNSGFAIACNTGLQWALDYGFEFIGTANNDIEVFQGWYEELHRPYLLWEDVGITGLISSKHRIVDGRPIEKYIIPKLTDGGLINTLMMSGGLWLSRREVLEKMVLYRRIQR